MRTEYRKKPPYYKKYKYKLELDLSIINSKKAQGTLIIELYDFLDLNIGTKNYKPMFYWSYFAQIYLTNDNTLDIIRNSIYGKCIKCLWRPAPGFEDIKNIKPNKPGESALWYGRFPYKIIIEIKSADIELIEAEHWCLENCFSSYRKSGYAGDVSFFFISSIDAIGFKLRFSDQIITTKMPSKKIAEQLFRKRIEDAKVDLNDFLEGDTI